MTKTDTNTERAAKENSSSVPCSKPSFGRWLKSARVFHGLTLEDVSKKSGMAKGHLSELENDVRPNPSLESAKKITGAFGMELWRVLKLIDF